MPPRAAPTIAPSVPPIRPPTAAPPTAPPAAPVPLFVAHPACVASDAPSNVTMIVFRMIMRGAAHMPRASAQGPRTRRSPRRRKLALAEDFGERRTHLGRRLRDGDARSLERCDLVLRCALAAGDDRAGV